MEQSELIMQNKTRILLLSFYAPPDLSAGSFRIAALLSAAKKQLTKVEIDCVTTMPNRYHNYEATADQVESDLNVQIHRAKLPKHGNSMFGQIRAYISYALFVEHFMRNNEKDYDIVVATSSRLMTAALGALWSRRLDKPLYLDIRDLFLDTIKGVFSKSKAKLVLPLVAILEKWTFQRAWKINVVSQGFVDDVKDVVPNVDIGVIPNGVDEDFLKPLPYREPDGPLKILYAGNIGEGQGLEIALPNAAKRLEGVAEFHIVGSGGRVDALRQALVENNVSNIYLHQPIARANLKSLYSDCDVLFLQLNKYPAFEKVLPSKLFEYAATGKPIIAAVPGYAAEFVRTNLSHAIVVDPCNSDALFEGVQAVRPYTTAPANHTCFVKRFDRRVLSRELLNDTVATACGSVKHKKQK